MLIASELLLAWLALGTSIPPDEELAARIRVGDHRAFRLFFERHHGTLLHFLHRRGVPESVADDLTQQAFVTLWERRDEIAPERSLRGLLFRIAYTRALNHFRDTARFADALPEPSAPAYDLAGEALLREAIEKAVQTLPEKRRGVFELCFVQELTYREAAEVLGISVKTVEHQMGHALKALRAQLVTWL